MRVIGLYGDRYATVVSKFDRIANDLMGDLLQMIPIDFNVSGEWRYDIHFIINILLAEDHLDNQKLIEVLLARAGAKVVCVQDGIEALAKALTQEFDLILMDMQMPNMDGLTAVRCLRSKGINKPIYALTADDSDSAVSNCLESGCNGHLTKPLNPDAISTVIRGINQ